MRPSKVICLMPVKNEVDILPHTLNIISQYCDHIIIADQMSTDGSREIYKNFEKVITIDNPRQGHSNEVRWDLLKKAREFGAGNLIVCLDADEYIPVELFKKFLNTHNFNIGDSFRFPWIQLWKSLEYFNDTGIWYRNYQRIAWVDDGKTNYSDKVIINDHTSRIPIGFLKKCKRVDNVPIIHLQWFFWNKTQYKQAWYKCNELIKSPESAISINSSYAHSLDSDPTQLTLTPTQWIKDYNVTLIHNIDSWHKLEIYKLFDQHKIDFFEPLEIWHIKELHNEFKKRLNRNPVSLSENYFLKKYKKIKRYIIKKIRY